jgi:hypothetical protein
MEIFFSHETVNNGIRILVHEMDQIEGELFVNHIAQALFPLEKYTKAVNPLIRLLYVYCPYTVRLRHFFAFALVRKHRA